jgi:DNA-binding NarL/FixJ family response regulator
MVALIEAETDLRVSGTVQDGTMAARQVETLKPDLVILGLSLEGCSGFDVLKEIRSRVPDQLVLIVSRHAEAFYALPALQAGACGYVMKQEATEMLLLAIRRVLDGDIFLNPGIENTVMQRFIRGAKVLDPLRTLTQREVEVLHRIGQGNASREIALQLGIGLRTIETHRKHIREKLGLKGAAELMQFAIVSPQMELHGQTPASGQRNGLLGLLHNCRMDKDRA